MQTFYLEGPGGLAGAKQSPAVHTAKKFYFEGGMAVGSVTPVTAGGASMLTLGASNVAILVGSGAPSVTTVPQGSLYIQTDGSSASTRLYVMGASSTWVAVTTAS